MECRATPTLTTEPFRSGKSTGHDLSAQIMAGGLAASKTLRRQPGKAGITKISIHGHSPIILEHIKGRTPSTTRRLSPTHGIDAPSVQRKCNADADTTTNAGLCARNHERRILFSDDLSLTPT